MSAKQPAKETVAPQTLTLTEEELKWAEVKAIIKRRELEAKRGLVESKLPAVLAFAGTTFAKEFKTLNSFVKFVSKKSGKKDRIGKRAPNLTEEQRIKIAQLRKSGKSGKDIREEVGCSLGQVNSVIYK